MKRLLIGLFLALAASAHVGSPDIYLDGNAGPYRLFVTVRVPQVIPGVAEVDVRSETSGVHTIGAVPIPIQGAGAKFAPVPEKLTVSAQDAQFFTGSLWMMESGSWQIRLSVDGAQGSATLSIPVPSAARSTQTMQGGLGAILFAMMLVLAGGLVAIVGANVREAKLDPGVSVDERNKTRGQIAMGIAFLILFGVLWLGKTWWDSEAAAYGQKIYKPLKMAASVDDRNQLTLKLSDPGGFAQERIKFSDPASMRVMDDLVPDHNHLMHLYAIRQPGLDVVYHLHPDQTGPGVFQLALPSISAGNYKLYADVVHENGFPETLVASINLPEIRGRQLAGDDAFGSAKPWNASLPSAAFELPDGFRMRWIGVTGVIRANEPTLFRFRLEDAHGSAPTDMQLYMGMLGHAAFVKTDGFVFAHIHPSGSAPMAALMLVQPSIAPIHDAMNMPGMGIPNEVSFPYGLPAPGRYRIFVQMKHGDTVETGVFDAQAS